VVVRAEWFDFATAREKMLPAQAPLISALEGALEAPE
jgi:predicted NUDIX family NTP pyrophosphohydrolase